MAEKPVRDSYAVCKSTRRSLSGDLYSGSPVIDSVFQIKQTEESQSTMDSNSTEVLGKQMQQQHSQEHQQKSSRHGVKGGILKEGQLQLADHVKKQRSADSEHCFLGSSLYYGGPDEHYDSLHTTKVAQDEQQKVKMEVKQLQEAMDPFNLEYATRGNWWKGSLYY